MDKNTAPPIPEPEEHSAGSTPTPKPREQADPRGLYSEPLVNPELTEEAHLG